MNLPTITTKRLILRKLKYSDRESIFKYASNPKVAKYVLWDAHINIYDTIEFLNLIYDAYNKNNPAPWGIKLKEGNAIIGTSGFIDINEDNNSAEVGYALDFNYWNKGIATEALNEVIRIGFEDLHFDNLTARCISENLPSKRVLEKCGFSHKKHQTMGMKVKGEFVDLDFYILSKENYNLLISNKS